jgi:hypothetical protein
MIDVFTSDLALPPKVCVLAPGPWGQPYHRRIPPDHLILAVNKAVLIPDVPIAMAMNCHADQDWFPRAWADFPGTWVFGGAAVERARALETGGRLIYTFQPAPEMLDPREMRSIDGVIRYGGTVSGNAIQLAYHFGAREILLCGVDMSGVSYWDGATNVRPDHGETWDAAPRLEVLIGWMIREKGLRIASLSPTKLRIPGGSGSDHARRP